MERGRMRGKINETVRHVYCILSFCGHVYFVLFAYIYQIPWNIFTHFSINHLLQMHKNGGHWRNGVNPNIDLSMWSRLRKSVSYATWQSAKEDKEDTNKEENNPLSHRVLLYIKSSLKLNLKPARASRKIQPRNFIYDTYILTMTLNWSECFGKYYISG